MKVSIDEQLKEKYKDLKPALESLTDEDKKAIELYNAVQRGLTLCSAKEYFEQVAYEEEHSDELDLAEAMALEEADKKAKEASEKYAEVFNKQAEEYKEYVKIASDLYKEENLVIGDKIDAILSGLNYTYMFYQVIYEDGLPVARIEVEIVKDKRKHKVTCEASIIDDRRKSKEENSVTFKANIENVLSEIDKTVARIK